jgi:hypothetical protein
MRVLRFLLVGGWLCALSNCQADGSQAPGLVVTSADLRGHIEASYSEGGRAVVLRARLNGSTVVSDILDERGHSMTSLAAAIATGSRIPVHGLLSNAASLATIELTARGLRRLGDFLPPGAADSPLVAALSRQAAPLTRALVMTRLAILHEWGREVRRRVPMSADEAEQFSAIIGQHARAIAASGTNVSRDASSLNAGEIAALLGPKRYSRYAALRTAWMSPAREHLAEVLP